MPPALRDGDLVAVVAPAGPVPPARLTAGLARIEGTLRLRVPPDITRAAGFLAGTDQRRADELNAALRDPDVRAILLARGGYGLMRILPLLDAAALRADPKPILGFSDATALLAWAAQTAGVRGIHGPVIAQLADVSDADVAAMVRMLRDPAPLGRLPWTLSPIGVPSATPCAGRLVGGNLTLIANLIGTPWQIDARGAIVLIEEVGEKPYAIDRYLTQIDLARARDGAAGALVGDFTRCTDPPLAPGGTDDPRPALAVLDERLRHLGLGGLGGAPFGHGKRNASLPWGARAVLHPDGVVEILDGAVA
jgi:muramoyltetrapeptide carboxypeptidase